MLNFDEDSRNAQILAVHYAKKVGDDYAIKFMLAETDITSPEEASRIANVFQQMTDLAIDDNEKNVVVEGIADIEFWMYKLFIKVQGYFKKNGYKAQWDQAAGDKES